MRKTKCYCDYCGKECEPTDDIKLPVNKKIDKFAVKNGVNILQMAGKTTVVKQRDICGECQKKIPLLMKMIPNVTFDDTCPGSIQLIY